MTLRDLHASAEEPRADAPASPLDPSQRPKTPLNLVVKGEDGVGEITCGTVDSAVEYSIIRRRTSPDPEDSSVVVGNVRAPAPGDQLHVIDDDVIPGARYLWGVAAIDGNGNQSDYVDSGEVAIGSPTPPEFGPRAVMTYAAVHRVLVVTWEHAESPVGISHYVLARHGGAQAPPWKIDSISGTVAAHFVDDSVEDGVEYQYVVIAYAVDGKHSKSISIYALSPAPGTVTAGTGTGSKR